MNLENFQQSKIVDHLKYSRSGLSQANFDFVRRNVVEEPKVLLNRHLQQPDVSSTAI